MFLRNYKQVIIGIVIGAVVAGVSVASADQSITAMRTALKIQKDGRITDQPTGAINYNGNVYVSARVLANLLGSEATFNTSTNTLSLSPLSTSGSSTSGTPGTSVSGNTTTTPTTGSTTTKTAPGAVTIGKNYTVQNFKLVQEQYATSVKAEVQNNGIRATDLTIKVNYYGKDINPESTDKNVHLLVSGYAIVHNLAPGEIRKFQAYAGAELPNVEYYTFDLDREEE